MAVFAFASGAVHSQTLLQDAFTVSANVNLATYGGGWKGYVSTAATDVTSASSPASGDAVFVGYGGSTGWGWLSLNNNTTASQVFAAVDTFSALTVANGSTISWNMGNANASNVVRLLVQVGGSWYASSATFSSSTVYTASTFGTALANGTAPSFSVTFSTAAANWQAFTLTPGSGMSLGATLGSDLSSNSITGVGFYVVSSSSLGQVTRIDNLTIAAVPERPTAALFFFGLAGIGLLAWRGGAALRV